MPAPPLPGLPPNFAQLFPINPAHDPGLTGGNAPTSNPAFGSLGGVLTGAAGQATQAGQVITGAVLGGGVVDPGAAGQVVQGAITGAGMGVGIPEWKSIVSYVGIHFFLLAIALFGVYLLFGPEVKTAVKAAAL